jgi:hypothetical protein
MRRTCATSGSQPAAGSLPHVPRLNCSRPAARRISLLALALIAVAVLLILMLVRSSSTTGYDISYPQCSSSYPGGPRFAIVGVNGGLANNANGCLASELRWAQDAPGQLHPEQPHLSLYINTGNPGTGVADWPQSGSAPTYGTCNGKLTNACSYRYGEQRAAHSYALAAAADPASPKAVPWWLDVELMTSWAGTYELNLAALQGFVAGLRSAGVAGPVGIYSTGAQWKDLTGLTAQTTPAQFGRRLPDWVAGTEATLSQAHQSCTAGGFTGADPTLAQYRTGRRDGDLRCPAGAR